MARAKASPSESVIAMFSTGELSYCKDLLDMVTIIVNARVKAAQPSTPRKTRSDAGKPRKVAPLEESEDEWLRRSYSSE